MMQRVRHVGAPLLFSSAELLRKYVYLLSFNVDAMLHCTELFQ